MRGAPIMLPRAEDRVAAKTPPLSVLVPTPYPTIIGWFSNSSAALRRQQHGHHQVDYSRDGDGREVPAGMERAGSFRSPDILAPAMIPVTAGKNRANMMSGDAPPAGAGIVFSRRVSVKRPTGPQQEKRAMKDRVHPR